MARDPRESRVLELLQQNDLANAQSLCSEIVADAPQDGQARILLGIVHARRKDLPEAERQLLEAVRIDPGLAAGWLRLGQVHERQGRYPEAEAPLLRSLALAPDLLEPRESLGRVYLRLGRHDEAIEQFRTVVEGMPASLPALEGLIRACRLAGRMTDAHQACMQALSLAPDNVGVLVCMGQLRRGMGDVEAALQFFSKALQLTPGYPPAVYGSAETLVRTGQAEQALALLQPFLTRLDDDPELLILYARIAARLQLDDTTDERLEQALQNPALEAGTRERIHFLLGDLRDRQSRYQEAFAHYHAGNRSVWQRLDDSKFHDEIDAIIAGFEVPHGALQAKPERPAITPIFIVGMPRSGTSLVEQMLAAHPQVYGAGELNVLSGIAAELGYAGASFRPDPDTLRIMARRYIEALQERADGSPFVTDKLPGNFLFLGLIALLFPAARILHLRRDPLDTCLSCYFQYFVGADRFGGHQYSYDLGQLGRYYRRYEKLMGYWRQRGIAFLDVQYEELVREPERVGRRMTKYCGLEWNEVCLNFHRSGRVVATASYDQVTRPIYNASVERWRHYADYLTPLREGLAGQG